MSLPLIPLGLMGGVITKLEMITANARLALIPTITVPDGVQAGDLFVLWDFGVASSVQAPVGFTILSNQTAPDGSRIVFSVKIADGTETTISGQFNAAGDFFNSKILLVFRADRPISKFIGSSPQNQLTNGNPTPQVVGSGAATKPAIVLAQYLSSGAVSPRTMTPAKDGEFSVGTAQWVAWKIFVTAPGNVTVDMDDEGNSNWLTSFYIEVE